MNQQINELLQKRMDRKDFLKHIAMGVAVMAGGATLVKTLTKQQTDKPRVAEGGYGAAAYGGASAPLKPMRPVRKIQ